MHGVWLRVVSFTRMLTSPGTVAGLWKDERCEQVSRPWMNMEV